MSCRPFELSATESIKQINLGALTASELVSSCISRIKKLELKIKAWAFFDPELAIKQASMIDGKKEASELILRGVPIGIKDIYNTLDMPTGMGSSIWKGFTPGNDARCVFNLRREGGVMMGKTTTAEFAVHHPSPTVNPHNTEHTPGTSSSGSAAAVAASMVPLAIGSQTAGSTIRPASYCGIYGFKPSFGLIPRTGVLKTVDALDHVTILTRTAKDLRLMFEAMRVKGNNFPLVHSKLEDRSKQKQEGPWKLALVRTHLWNEWEEYAKKDLLRFTERLAGDDEINIVEATLPEEFKNAHSVHKTIYNKALSYYYQPEYKNNHDQLSSIFRNMIESGMKMSKDDYISALKKQNLLARKLERFFENYDGIITLSTAGEAKKGLHFRDTTDTCLIWTLCGVPAVTVPVFTGPKSLPFGAQIIFKKYHDYSLLNFLEYLDKQGFIKEANYEIN